MVFALGGAEPALAHVDLVEVEPALGAVLETTPAEVTMRFSGQVNPAAFEFHLFHRDGRVVPFTGDGPVFDGTAVTIDLPALDLGTYVVVWSSTGLDGHLAAGQTHFSIGFEEGGSVADLTGDSRGGGTADNLVRWALSGALALAIGLLWLRASGLTSTTGRIAKVGCAAFLLALLRLILVAGRVGGGHLDGLSRIAGAGPGRFGWTLLLGGTLLIWLARRPMLQLAGVVASAAGSILAGHLANQAGAGLLVALGAAHLLGAVFWIGAPAAALLWARQAGITAFARRFTPWAAASVIVLATSGIGLSVLRTAIEEAGGLGALASYRYGTVLLAKWAVLVLVVVPLGAYHLLVSLRGGIAGRAGAIAEESDRTPTGPAPEAGTGRGRRLLRAEVAGLAAVIGLGTILGGLSPARSEQLQLESGDLLAAPASFESCTSGQSQTDQFVCVVRYFEHVAGTDGMPAALKEVTERWVNGDSWMQLNCHAIGHKLGRLGYRIYKDVPTAFEAGSDPCDYGYLHGVIEGASADFSDDELRAAMTKLCDGTGDPTIHTHRQCIHGLGHAAARRVNNDLPRAMEFCREFYKPGMSADASKDLESLVFTLCVTGVSMEWNTQPKAQEARNLPIGHPDTLLGQCAALETIFQNGCVEYGTSSLGGIPEREIEARDWCDANLDDPLPCYQSIGRDVIWSPLISDEEAMAICMGGRPGIYAEQCITRALGSVATISLDASSIDEFCPVVPEQYQYLCPIVRDAMAVQIEQTTRGFITEPGSGP